MSGFAQIALCGFLEAEVSALDMSAVETERTGLWRYFTEECERVVQDRIFWEGLQLS